MDGTRKRRLDRSLKGFRLEPQEFNWEPRDVILYALSVGATVPDELPYLYEAYGPAVLPTFAVIPGTQFLESLLASVDIDLKELLHAGEEILLHRAIPATADVRTSYTCIDIWDKGRAALVVWEAVTSDGDGPIFTTRTTAYISGAGGFGGERGPSGSRQQTERAREPDHVVRATTGPSQAAIYRLCGDFNPIHIDPKFAREAGQEGPILHGLCTLGYVGRALVQAVCGGDVTRVSSISGRFTGVIHPGESLTTRMWLAGDDRVEIETVRGDGGAIFSNGTAVVRKSCVGLRP